MGKKSILVVEDDPATAAGIQSALLDQGYLVPAVVNTGEQALLAIDAEGPDLILMDIHLAGGLSGIKTAEKIQKNHTVPVIYLSTNAETALVEQAKKTRPYGYIIKPVSSTVLRTEIEIALYKFGLDEEYQRERVRLEEGIKERTRDLEQANEALRESRQRFHDFIQLLPEVVFESDLSGHLTLVNENSYSFFGYTREDLPDGVNLFNHIIPEDRARVREGFGRITRGGPTSDSEYTGVKKDGTHISFLAYTSPVMHNNRPVGIRGILVDITGRKKTERAMQQALAKLNLLNSITRHDILNKLTALNIYISLAAEGVTNPKSAGYLGECTRIAAIISRQVEFMRDYQEMGVRSPVWQDPVVPVKAVLETCPLEGITVRPVEPGYEIFIDPLFERVIYNLIDNSLRHGRHVKMITFTLHETADGLMLVYEDDGIGVPEDYKDRIFEKGCGENTGLGLFLAREILGITGITIRETGVFGQGARFEMTVPGGAFRRTGDGIPVARQDRP
ncbi:MAG: response regulator [Methanoregula sp.]